MTQAAKVLVIDDDVKLCRLLDEYLRGFGYEVSCAHAAGSGMKLLALKKPDLVILDVMLPEKNGFEALKEIRTTSRVPVIMLTARGDVADRVVGLELGADDYLAKPFEPRELAARIQAVLRRGDGRGDEDEPRTFGPLRLDAARREALLDGKLLDLSTSEFDVLWLLASQPSRVWTRDQIMNSIRGIDWSAYDRSVDVLISRVRQKLGDDPRTPAYIRTVRGSGYAFIARRDGGTTSP